MISGLGPGGAEMMLYRLLKKIDRQKFDPIVLSLIDIEGPLTKNIEDLGVVVKRLQLRSRFDIFALFRLIRILKSLKPDILHTQLFAADIIGRTLGKMLKVPVVITSIRNIYYGSMFRYFLLRLTEGFADQTTFVSQAAAERFIELKVLPRDKARVIYNGLEPGDYYTGLNEHDKRKKRTELSLKAGNLLLLSVGSLTRQKGCPVLFRALKQLDTKGYEYNLVIAGSGPLQEELEKDILELELENKVKMIGRFDNVPDLMAAADVLVLSSLWEGLPGVVMEAMASELPVVATAVGGTPELVMEGETGYLVEPGNEDQLAWGMSKIADLTAEKRQDMGLAGRRRVEEFFHIDKMVQAYEQLYTESIEIKSKG